MLELAKEDMVMIFIGSGSAFTIGGDNYQSNILIVNKKNNKKLLIDCGSDARQALFDLNYSHSDITDVYISHLHSDHSGGLEWLALSNKFDPKQSKPNLYANTHIIKDIWQHTLSGGLSTIQGVKAELSTFFSVYPIKDNGSFMWENIEFQTVQTVHVVSGYAFMHSYGLMFSINKKRIFITTDTQFAPNQLQDFYGMSDIIFHDCETNSSKSGVHAHYTELCTLSAETKKKIWLYHYHPGSLPNAKADGFCGFVKKGQAFSF